MGRVILVGGAGVVLAVLVLIVARRGNLSMRYTMGWLFVSVCLVIGGIVGSVVDSIARALDVEPFTVMLTAILAAFLGITVQLSISVSGLLEAVRTLAEANSLLEERLRRQENDVSPTKSVRVEVQELENRRHE